MKGGAIAHYPFRSVGEVISPKGGPQHLLSLASQTILHFYMAWIKSQNLLSVLKGIPK